MQRFRRRLGHLACDIVQPDGEAVGKPVVFVHGLGGGTWGWENFQSYFAARGRVTCAPELPYHGTERDPRLGDYSVETFALYVSAALAALGDCFVVGHSMGGIIAQKLAETTPNAGYVFLCSAPPWSLLRRDYWPMWKHILRHPLRGAIQAIRQQPMVLDEALEEELVNNRLSPAQRHEIYSKDVPDSGRASLQMALGLVKVDERPIQAPCLVVGGLADGLIPAREQERIAARYRCPLKLFDRGHMLILEEGWEEVADYLLRWCESVEQGTPQPGAAQVPVSPGQAI